MARRPALLCQACITEWALSGAASGNLDTVEGIPYYLEDQNACFPELKLNIHVDKQDKLAVGVEKRSY